MKQVLNKYSSDSSHGDRLQQVFNELRKAETKFPGFPVDPVHAVAILSEECGEATQASLDFYYRRENSTEKLRKELCHTAAMAIRVLIHLEHFVQIDKGDLVS